MTPVTTRGRPLHRVDARRRQGTRHSTAQPPTLFDGADGESTVQVAACQDRSWPAPPTGRIDAGQRVADPPMAAGSGETLDRLVVGSWERLLSHADAPCLLCGGTMEPRYGAQAASIGGRCRDCRTTLS
jgi:hypothetical protein